MSRFTDLIVLVRDFKSKTDKLLQELTSFDANFAGKESEIMTLSNQILVIRNQKETLEAEANIVLDNAHKEAQKIKDNASSVTLIAQNVMVQAGKDREEAARMMQEAKAKRDQVEFDRADFERQVASFNDKRNRLQEAIK